MCPSIFWWAFTPEIFMTAKKSEVHFLQMESITQNPKNKLEIRDLDVLENSIKTYGVLTPITVFWNPKNLSYTIISGHRRFEACRQLGMTTIPANVVEAPETAHDEFLEICAGNIARTSDDDILAQVKGAVDYWESLSEEEQEPIRKRLNVAYKKRMTKKDPECRDFRPRDEFVRAITGISLSARSIARKLAEIAKGEEEPSELPKAEKKPSEPKRKTRSFPKCAKAMITELQYLTSEYAEDMLDDETISIIDQVISLLKPFAE